MITKPAGVVDQINGLDVQRIMGAADFLGTGAIEVPDFESDIYDIVRRDSVSLQRIKQRPATGHPHRYFEQLAIATATAVDPRNISATASGPTRVERPAFIKAMTAQSNLSLFDRDVTEQQGQFAGVVAKDIDDVISGIEILRANMLWNGTDTSLVAPTALQWMGGLAQITQQFVISPSASIIDGIKTVVATMVSSVNFKPKPTACYMNPLLADYIDQEAKASHIELGTSKVTAGLEVECISTQVGKLPLIGEPFLATSTVAQYGFAAPPAGYKNYYCVVTVENDIEIAVISGREYNPHPRLFQLGLIGNLAGQFVGVKFDAVIFKGAGYAHAVIAVQRP